VAVIAVDGEHRHTRALEGVDHAGDLELVGHRVREHRVAADRPRLLERDEPSVARVALGQHRAVGRDPGHRVQHAIDLLVAERRHRRAVRARVHERDARLRLLVEGPPLGGEQGTAFVHVGHDRL
jgi:hypothetical protein